MSKERKTRVTQVFVQDNAALDMGGFPNVGAPHGTQLTTEHGSIHSFVKVFQFQPKQQKDSPFADHKHLRRKYLADGNSEKASGSNDRKAFEIVSPDGRVIFQLLA